MTWSPGVNSPGLQADLLDDPRRLVAEDGGRGEGVEAVDEVQVAVADAGGDDAHEHLAARGLVDVDVLDRERLIGPVEHGSFHLVLLVGTRPRARSRAGSPRCAARFSDGAHSNT